MRFRAIRKRGLPASALGLLPAVPAAALAGGGTDGGAGSATWFLIGLATVVVVAWVILRVRSKREQAHVRALMEEIDDPSRDAN